MVASSSLRPLLPPPHKYLPRIRLSSPESPPLLSLRREVEGKDEQG